ncbi:DUF977 family protein [Candidatus Woesearchaeota archaeon]|nr:DUF977 family protein [Candidatus Woesearchaeota archaeon]
MKSHKFRNKILKFVKKLKVVTTSEVAEKLGVSWNTAEKYLLDLALEGSVQRMKKSGVNLWVIK